MELIKEIFCKPDLKLDGRTIIHEAVRGIIYHNGKFLMVYSTVNKFYEFPGGGVNLGESVTEALIREIREECGVQDTEITGSFGKTIEYDKPREPEYDLIKLVSYYYFCRIDPGKPLFPQVLEGYEKELGMQPAWVDVNTALEVNDHFIETTTNLNPRWLKREVIVLNEIQRRHQATAGWLEQYQSGVFQQRADITPSGY